MNDREKNPLLSVIVPIFNTENYLEKCISSILNQTYRNMEIILVDDGSIDGSLQICRKFQRQDSRVRVISKENGGLIRARKTGLSHARGELIGFVDSDDWIDEDMYAELVKRMEETGCDLLSFGLVREQDTQESYAVVDHYKEGIHSNLESSIYATMLYDMRYREFGLQCSVCNKIFKKRLLDKVYADINENVFYGEDAITLYPYCLLAEKIYILHKAYYHYNIRNDSMCAAPDERLPYNNYIIYKELYTAFSKSNCKWVLVRQLKQYMLMLERHNLFRLYHINVTAIMENWKFGYSEELFDKKFVIYGAGVCGQALYEKLFKEDKVINMVCWVDKDAEKKMDECTYPIRRPDALLDMKWNNLIIAVKTEKLAEQIKDSLLEMYGIEKNRMYWAPAEQILR